MATGGPLRPSHGPGGLQTLSWSSDPLHGPAGPQTLSMVLVVFRPRRHGVMGEQGFRGDSIHPCLPGVFPVPKWTPFMRWECKQFECSF